MDCIRMAPSLWEELGKPLNLENASVTVDARMETWPERRHREGICTGEFLNDKDTSTVAPPDPKQLSEHFTRAEFSCNHCNTLPTDKLPPKQLLEFLEKIRANFDSPVIINSGYRCPTHNANVGGAKNSQHLYGRAADIVVKGQPPVKVWQYANTLIGDSGGVGKYNTFTHIDTRGTRARWDET